MVYPDNNTTQDHAKTQTSGHRPRENQGAAQAETLYIFPELQLTATQLRQILDGGSRKERAQVVANLLSFAPWHDIWTLVSKHEVKELFPHLKLPKGLHQAWASLLGVALD